MINATSNTILQMITIDTMILPPSNDIPSVVIELITNPKTDKHISSINRNKTKINGFFDIFCLTISLERQLNYC